MINIRHARLDEKYKIYQWLSLSDTTIMHMGKPNFPESPIPSWAQFRKTLKTFISRKMVVKKDLL
jgi:hypothetical protein